MITNPEFKQKFVETLRSDRFKQIQDKLGDGGNGRCCLGVASDLALEMGLVEGVSVEIQDRSAAFTPRMTRAYRYYSVTAECFLEEDSTLPSPIADALFEGKDDPVVVVDGTRMGLARLNDNGVSFREIADLIEQQL